MQELGRLMEAITKIGDMFIDFAPKIVIFLVVIIIGYIAASVISGIVQKTLEAIKIDKLNEKIREIEIFSNVEIKLSSLLSKSIYWLIMLIVISVAADTIELDIIKNGIESILGHIPETITAILIFVIGALVAQLISSVVISTCDAMAISAGRIIGNFVFYFLLILISITSLQQIGIATEVITNGILIAMAAIFMAFALGYGFASKDIMANVLASFYGRDKFMVGQTIRVGEVTGKIIKLDSTSVTLDAGDRRIILPLSKLLNSTVEVF